MLTPEAIDQFGKSHGLSGEYVDSCLPVLNLLDSLGVSRREVHGLVVSRLRAALLEAVMPTVTDEPTLSRLLDMTLPLSSRDEIRPVVFAVLDRLARLTQEVVSAVLASPGLYQACPYSVKRKLWAAQPSVFTELELPPVVEAFVAENNDGSAAPPYLDWCVPGLSGGTGTSAVVPPVPGRKQAVRSLAQSVGNSPEANALVVKSLREMFERSGGDVVFSLLRCELLMELQSQGADKVCVNDPCHELVWCLDACGRDNKIDKSRAREIRTALTSRLVAPGKGPKTSAFAADASFALSNPITVRVALHHAFSSDQDIVDVSMKLLFLADEALARLSPSSPEMPYVPPPDGAFAPFFNCLAASFSSGTIDEVVRVHVESSHVCKELLLYQTVLRARGPASDTKLLPSVVKLGLDDLNFTQSLVTVALSKSAVAQPVWDALEPHKGNVLVRIQLVRYLVSCSPKAPDVMVLQVTSDALAFAKSIIGNVSSEFQEKVRLIYSALATRYPEAVNKDPGVSTLLGLLAGDRAPPAPKPPSPQPAAPKDVPVVSEPEPPPMSPEMPPMSP